MRNIRWTYLTGVALAVGLVASACSSAAATPSSAADTPFSAVAGATATATTTSGDQASAATLTLASTDGSMGSYLTGANGMTLYVLTTDTADTSSCSGSCATNWPPLTVTAGTTVSGPSAAMAGFATIARADGSTQVTYNHMPLYYFAGDSAAGDTNGQGKNNTWYVAPVSGTLVNASPAATSAAAAPTTSSGY